MPPGDKPKELQLYMKTYVIKKVSKFSFLVFGRKGFLSKDKLFTGVVVDA